MKNKTAGFTLIELMVVIVILGILSAVIAPRIPSFVNKAKEGKTKGNLATLRSVLNIYYSDNDGMYPRGPNGDAIGDCLMKYVKRLPYAEMPPYHPAVDAGRLSSMGGPNEEGGWWYGDEETEDTWGELKLNCATHSDASGVPWSSF